MVKERREGGVTGRKQKEEIYGVKKGHKYIGIDKDRQFYARINSCITRKGAEEWKEGGRKDCIDAREGGQERYRKIMIHKEKIKPEKKKDETNKEDIGHWKDERR